MGTTAMNEVFRKHIETLEPSVVKLKAMAPVTVATLPRHTPAEGIYLFSDAGKHLYVGRTNQLRKRLQSHCRPSSGHNSATFAFLLAREATGRTTPSYKANGSRADLEKNPEFREAFLAAKRHVRSMDVRFVAESDPIRQALLEMYASLELDTKYNNFDNH